MNTISRWLGRALSAAKSDSSGDAERQTGAGCHLRGPDLQDVLRERPHLVIYALGGGAGYLIARRTSGSSHAHQVGHDSGVAFHHAHLSELPERITAIMGGELLRLKG